MGDARSGRHGSREALAKIRSEMRTLTDKDVLSLLAASAETE